MATSGSTRTPSSPHTPAGVAFKIPGSQTVKEIMGNRADDDKPTHNQKYPLPG